MMKGKWQEIIFNEFIQLRPSLLSRETEEE